MSVTGTQIENLAKKQQYKCNLTGVELSPDDAEADHIQPVADGGKHEIENVQIVHQVINRMKGTMTQDQFVYWCNLVAKHANR